MKAISISILVLVLVSGCGLKIELPSWLKKTETQEDKQFCESAKESLTQWMSLNSPCQTDSDCFTQYGGCIRVIYINTTDMNRLN
ncbi:MAG: hypothetical protein ACKOA8_19450, partial [Deltaproteobacteria bacterium]